MQTIVVYVLILLGIVWIVLSVLEWFGVIKRSAPRYQVTGRTPTGWDVLIVLIEKLPWLAVLGLIQIYAGMKMMGIVFP
jgi:hypothetical protein